MAELINIAGRKTLPLVDAKVLLKNRLRREQEEAAAKPPEFYPGDFVRLDTGALGIVSESEESPGSTATVFHFEEDGTIAGPAFGYELEKVNI